jgi:DNA processing protein
MTDLHLQDLVALSLLPSWWWRTAAERLRAGETPRAVLDQLLAERHQHACHASTLRSRAAAALARAATSDLASISWRDPVYPSALAAIVDPPFVLWTRGSHSTLDGPAVAIVGSRAASPYALAVAERLASDLASQGIVVVSGLARGVDSAAHRGALAGGGTTVAVLGSGADVIYPIEHASLARDIERSGIVMSELVPGTPPHRHFFPLRNRIISGLSRAVVVIEAGQRSGSLITARAALDQGRDVLAVPGNILDGRNRGAHALLKDGAKIVESADDILEELGFSGTSRPGPPTHAPGGTGSPVDPVLACLGPGEALDLDAIAGRSGLSPARLLPRLFELELNGLVARAGGGRFLRVDRPC